jgi:S1-C subfamily serine protease
MKPSNYLYCFLFFLFIFINSFAQEKVSDSVSAVVEEIITSSGTGFLISEEGYLITSYHIIDEAKKIDVEITLDNLSKKYCAKLVSLDSLNDLALLKISCGNLNLKRIPFEIVNQDAQLGTTVYTLGYPMVETMGKAIKLSNGIISSTKGFMGNEQSYQISVPINPGNSGGPLFDEKGNLVGVIKSIYSGAENVAYAIKSKYVNKLCSGFVNPKEKLMSNKKMDFLNQVNTLKDLVCLITATN